MSSNRLADLLSLHNVPRWNCGLQFYRRQTVAEHSFNVACIAMQIFESLNRYPPSMLYSILRWSLVHDAPETYTGDINHLIKKELPRDKINEIEYLQCPWYHAESQYPSPLVLAICKIADKIDEVWTLDHNGDAIDYGITDARERAVKQIREHTARAVREFSLLELPSIIQYVMAGIGSSAYPGTSLWPVDDKPQQSPQDPQLHPTPPDTA